MAREHRQVTRGGRNNDEPVGCVKNSDDATSSRLAGCDRLTHATVLSIATPARHIARHTPAGGIDGHSTVHRTSTDRPAPTTVVVAISLIAIRNGKPSTATNATTATTNSLRITQNATERSTEVQRQGRTKGSRGKVWW